MVCHYYCTVLCWKAVSIQKTDYNRPGQYDSTEQWKKDEILAAKIKKFLSVSG